MVQCYDCGEEMKSYRGGGDQVACFKCGRTIRSPDLKKNFWAVKREPSQPAIKGNPPDPKEWLSGDWDRLERERANLASERKHLRQERQRLEVQLAEVSKQELNKRVEEAKKQQQLDKLAAMQADQRTRVQIAVEEATPKKKETK